MSDNWTYGPSRNSGVRCGGRSYSTKSVPRNGLLGCVDYDSSGKGVSCTRAITPGALRKWTKSHPNRAGHQIGGETLFCMRRKKRIARRKKKG